VIPGFWPFGSLAASSEELVVSVFGWPLRLPRSQITAVVANYTGGPGFYWLPGLRIEHVVPGIPKLVVFRVLFRLNVVEAALVDLGYDVREQLGWNE
jgi:hypothetical protein